MGALRACSNLAPHESVSRAESPKGVAGNGRGRRPTRRRSNRQAFRDALALEPHDQLWRVTNDYDLSSFPRIEHRVAGGRDSCRLRQLPSSQQPVQASNPSVTYNYRTDQELLRASQNATTYCGQYQTAPRAATLTNNADGSKTAVFECVRRPRSRAGAGQSQPELYVSDGPGAGASITDRQRLLPEVRLAADDL